METAKQTHQLQHLDEFRALLEQYSPSEKSLAILRSLPLVLLVGPTAAGRNTLINLLVQTGRYHFIVSDTTRKKRLNNGVMEQDGVEYWFITEEQFINGLRNGEYIEAAIIHDQQVSGNNISQIEVAAKADKIAINEVTATGPGIVHHYKPDTLIVFLLPPSFETWMERIRGRGNVDDTELRRRLESAVKEITTALKEDYYHFIVNYEIHEAAQAVDELANGRLVDLAKQQIGRDHAEQLLIELNLFLQAK